MELYIEKCKSSINIIKKNLQYKLPQCEIYWGFLGFRDFEDKEKFIKFDFSIDANKFQIFMENNVKVFGGGDQCEDIIGAFEEANKYDWNSSTKIIFFFADSPNHGTRYYEGESINDDHPEYDSSGTKMYEQISKIRLKKIFLFLIEINLSTKKMFKEIKHIYNKLQKNSKFSEHFKAKIHSLESFENNSLLDFIEKCLIRTFTLTKTQLGENFRNLLLEKNKEGTDIKPENKSKCSINGTILDLSQINEIMHSEINNYSASLNLSKYKMRKASSLKSINSTPKRKLKPKEDLNIIIDEELENPMFGILSEIKERFALESLANNNKSPCVFKRFELKEINLEEKILKITEIRKIFGEITISEKKFSNGSSKNVYLCKPSGFLDNEVKIAKKEIDEEISKKEEFNYRDIICAHVANYFVKEFNKILISTFNLPNQIRIVLGDLCQIGEVFYVIEELLEGKFVKYNNNFEYVSNEESLENKIAQCFSHWSFIYSKEKYLIHDLQGVGLVFTDVQVTTLENNFKMFGTGNLSLQGIFGFLNMHKCNELCKILGLKNEYWPCIDKIFNK